MENSQSPLPPTTRKVEVQLSFPHAVEAVIGGQRVRRLEWADPEEHCLLKDNFLMIRHNGKFHAWIVSEGDLLAVDWIILK